MVSNIHHIMLELPSYVYFPSNKYLNDKKDKGYMLVFIVCIILARSCQKYVY